MINYSAGGNSGTFTYNSTIETLKIFKSDCPRDVVFRDTFDSNGLNGEINVTYKVTFELELKETETPMKESNLLHKLYSNSEFSDVKIQCDGKVFNCHKIVLSGQSEVFKKMLVENDFVEATSGEIKITDTPAQGLYSTGWFKKQFSPCWLGLW